MKLFSGKKNLDHLIALAEDANVCELKTPLTTLLMNFIYFFLAEISWTDNLTCLFQHLDTWGDKFILKP